MYFPGKYPIKSWSVKSRTQVHPDTTEPLYYTLELWGDGKITCNCSAGSYNRLCWHRKKIKDELESGFGSVDKAIEQFRKDKKNDKRTNT